MDELESPIDSLVDIAPDRKINKIRMTVRELVFRGSNTLCYLDSALAGEAPIIVELSANTAYTPQVGEGVDLVWAVRDTLIFSLDPVACNS